MKTLQTAITALESAASATAEAQTDLLNGLTSTQQRIDEMAVQSAKRYEEELEYIDAKMERDTIEVRTSAEALRSHTTKGFNELNAEIAKIKATVDACLNKLEVTVKASPRLAVFSDKVQPINPEVKPVKK